MKLADIDTTAMEFTEEELDYMGEVLVKAEEIRADKKLYELVESHMKKRADQITSVADLRKKHQELALKQG